MALDGSPPFRLWYGRDEPPPEVRVLRAGPLLLELHGSDLRYACSSRNEVVRRIYMAVRDLNWNTPSAAVGEPEIEEGDGEFRVRVAARTTEGDIDFAWSATLEGTRDGVVSYELDGTAEASFAFAKIGLCLHHPIRETAGRLFRGGAPTTPVGGELPRHIGPQISVDNGAWDLPLFEPVEWLEIDLPHGERIRFDFEGDLFEMEDQRNWTDGSLRRPRRRLVGVSPHDRGRRSDPAEGGVPRGWLGGRRPTRRGVGDSSVRLGEPLGRRMPPVGVGMASHGEPLGPRETELLRELAPAHLRADIRPGETSRLLQAVEEAYALGCELELALFLNGDESFAVETAEALRDADVRVARVLVFDDGREVTPLEHVDAVRRLFESIPVGGGTNVYFNELNRNRPDPERLAWSPIRSTRRSAFDELSLVESLKRRARQCGRHAPSPRRPGRRHPGHVPPRFNAVAVVEETTEQGCRDRSIRARCRFSVRRGRSGRKSLAEAGAAALTYFETTGWRGSSSASADRQALRSPPCRVSRFRSTTFCSVCGWRDAELLDCISSDPLGVTALAVRRNGETT
jgi:hypothetical protein